MHGHWGLPAKSHVILELMVHLRMKVPLLRTKLQIKDLKGQIVENMS